VKDHQLKPDLDLGGGGGTLWDGSIPTFRSPGKQDNFIGQVKKITSSGQRERVDPQGERWYHKLERSEKLLLFDKGKKVTGREWLCCQ